MFNSFSSIANVLLAAIPIVALSVSALCDMVGIA
jgi:hypothetical protein